MNPETHEQAQDSEADDAAAGRALSVAAFGRDITSLLWSQLTPEEQRAVNELTRLSFPTPSKSVLVRLAETLKRSAPSDPTAEASKPVTVAPSGLCFPAGTPNRKAKRKARARLKREAWAAFQLQRRERAKRIKSAKVRP